MRIADFDEQQRARSRFAARIVGPASRPGLRIVELYAGQRFEPGRFDPRVPVAAIELTAEQADDLVLALGEPLSAELPERLRPHESWELP
jgi:hypothetical protein